MAISELTPRSAACDGFAHRRTELISIAALLAVAFIGLQLTAMTMDVATPIDNLSREFVTDRRAVTSAWVALALASIGLVNRQRIVLIATAVVIDLVALIGEFALTGDVHSGVGPLVALFGLVGYASTQWRGTERRDALVAALLGSLPVLAFKLTDSFLTITAKARPRVLDEYVYLADQALGNPSWFLGRVLEIAGPVPSWIFDFIYRQLPAALVIVTIWQLRNVKLGWPRHFLLRTALAIGLIGPLFYLLFPVVGPHFAFGSGGHGLEVLNAWPSVEPTALFLPEPIAFDGYTPRNCMPSLHTAWATAIFLHTRVGPRWLRYGGAFWLFGTLMATMGFGFHYGVDIVAGVIFALTVDSALRDPERGWAMFRFQQIAFGGAAFASLLLSYRFLPELMAQHRVVAGSIVLMTLAAVCLQYRANFFTVSRSDRARSVTQQFV